MAIAIASGTLRFPLDFNLSTVRMPLDRSSAQANI